MKMILCATVLLAVSALGQELKDVLKPEQFEYKPWKPERGFLTETGAAALGLSKLTMEERAAWVQVIDQWIKRVIADVLKNVEQRMAVLMAMKARAAPPAAAVVPRFVTVTNVSGKESITKLTSDGSTIELLDGSVWRVNAADRATSSIWLEVEDVILVNDEVMINVDQDGDYVHVRRIGG